MQRITQVMGKIRSSGEGPLGVVHAGYIPRRGGAHAGPDNYGISSQTSKARYP